MYNSPEQYQDRQPEQLVLVERCVAVGERVFAHADEVVDYQAIRKQARRLIEAHVPPEKKMSQKGYSDNGRTVLFETITENAHVSEIRFEGSLEQVHQEIMLRLLNSYYRDIPEHEKNRNFSEICEELATHATLMLVVRGELPNDTRVDTASDYDFDAPLERGFTPHDLGYRKKNRKGMLREAWVEQMPDGTWQRVLQQVSRSNAVPNETAMMLHNEGVTIERRGQLDVDLLATQMIRRTSDFDDTAEGVISVMRRLDAYSGPNIMYGEPKSANTPSYEDVHRISAEREAKFERYAEELATFEAELDERLKRGEITQHEWTRLYVQRVDKIADAICVIAPSYTAATFGKHVEHAYYRAHELYLRGDTGGAAAEVALVASSKDTISFCGMGADVRQGPNNENDSPSELVRLLEMSKKWKFVDGKCRVVRCPTAGKKTKVGPCDVCAGCQRHFDNGEDPSKVYLRQAVVQAREAAWNFSQPSHEQKTRTIESVYGKHASVKIEHEVGGAKTVVYDARDGSVLALNPKL